MSDLQQRMYEALDSACKCTGCQAAAAVLIAEDAVRDLAAKVEALCDEADVNASSSRMANPWS